MNENIRQLFKIAKLIILGVIAIIILGMILHFKSNKQPYYAPGETLNPSCSPQDPRCGVRH